MTGHEATATGTEPPLRLGLAGAGRWGRRYIATIGQMQGVELAYLVSRNPESGGLVPSGCRVLSIWQELMERDDCDGVIIAAPPEFHYDMARAAIARRLPVVVEKPMTLRLEDARALRDLSRQHRTLVLVGHTHLFSHGFRTLKANIGRVGRVRLVRSHGANFGPVRPDTPMMWDYGSHDIAMCLDLIGDLPTRVGAALQDRRRVDGGLGETVEIRLLFPGEIEALVRVSNIADRKVRSFAVTGERGSLDYDDVGPRKLLFRPGSSGKFEAIPVNPEPPLTRLVYEFAEAIRNHETCHESVRLGRDVVDILARCTAEIESG